MSHNRDIRRLAFQALFQLDARGERDALEIKAGLDDADQPITDEVRTEAFDRAHAAFKDRAKADAAMLELAPTWPAHRQAAVDRAILRLAHYEMTKAIVHPKIAVNEAVELAKQFSTDKSPAFINGLLDKILKKVLAAGGGDAPTSAAPSSNAPPSESHHSPDEGLS